MLAVVDIFLVVTMVNCYVWRTGRKLCVSQIFHLPGNTTFKAVKPNQRKLLSLFFQEEKFFRKVTCSNNGKWFVCLFFLSVFSVI